MELGHFFVGSFVSAITVLGNPVEIYFYGSTYGLILVSFIPMTWSLAYCYVPVYHNLQLTSAYEVSQLVNLSTKITSAYQS